MPTLKTPLAIIAFIACYVFVQTATYNRVNSNTRGIIWSDAEGYYQYLPGLFIIKDFHKLPHGSVWPYVNDKDEYVDKYSCGVSYFEAPFFLVAHIINAFTNGENRDDYFNPIYAKAIAFGGVTYGFIGLLLLFFALRKDFKWGIIVWVLASVFLGTNLFHYTTKEMGMSHVYSFCLFAALLFHLPRYLKSPSILNGVVLGAILGWIFLIRPTNGIVSLLLIGYQVYSVEALRERILFLLKNFRSLIVAAIVAFLFLLPQFLYWKEMTGNWIYYSYTHESFQFWLQPKIAAVLFDVQNGLFLYSPLVLIQVAGMIYGSFRKQWSSPVLLLIFALATYVFASWWAWWFGGAFGHRCYVEYYALFTLPLAGIYDHLWKTKPKWVRYSFVLLTVALMIYSVRLSYLYTSIGGPWDGPDWRWNWEKFEWILSHFFKKS